MIAPRPLKALRPAVLHIAEPPLRDQEDFWCCLLQEGTPIVPFHQLETRRADLDRARIIFGLDVISRRWAIFYGRDASHDPTAPAAAVALVFGSDQEDKLCEWLQHEKGDCCYLGPGES